MDTFLAILCYYIIILYEEGQVYEPILYGRINVRIN